MEGTQPTGPVIRRATPEDIPLIRELAGVCFRDTYRTILSPEQMEYMMDWMYSERSLQKQMEQDGHVYFITSVDGVPCAYFSIQPLGLQEDGAYLFEFQKMYLLPAYKGKGIGRHMVGHVFQFVRDAACGWPCRIELHVNRYNPIVNFHKHMGFSILREGDFPIGNGYYMNDYIMGVTL
jgi:GNAT superfamily N-acetyltransferase